MDKKVIELRNIITNAEKITFLGGAGVSTESGIPDFRSENGIYNTVQMYGNQPEKILSRTFFYENTELFYDFYRNEIAHEGIQPNSAHYALAKLEKMGKLIAVITQNIDGLHQLAGCKKVLDLHGSINRNYCMDCHRSYEVSYILATEGVPKCVVCGGVVKPDVVLYDEELNDMVLKRSIEAVSQADVLIIGGTSLNVYPAAGLIQYFKGNALVLINKSETPYDHKADLLIRGDIGRTLSEAMDS